MNKLSKFVRRTAGLQKTVMKKRLFTFRIALVWPALWLAWICPSAAGIYAVVPFDDGSGSTNDFPVLLQNPAVAGLALRIQWQTMQPQPTQYDFSIIQQALSQAAAQNKSVQLILLPGFFSPAWLLTNLVSYDQFPTTNSGKALFTVQEGQYQGQRMELPSPWNSTYKTAWHNFLLELQRRFGGASNLVSIAVTGPTSASA